MNAWIVIGLIAVAVVGFIIYRRSQAQVTEQELNDFAPPTRTPPTADWATKPRDEDRIAPMPPTAPTAPTAPIAPTAPYVPASALPPSNVPFGSRTITHNGRTYYSAPSGRVFDSRGSHVTDSLLLGLLGGAVGALAVEAFTSRHEPVAPVAPIAPAYIPEFIPRPASIGSAPDVDLSQRSTVVPLRSVQASPDVDLSARDTALPGGVMANDVDLSYRGSEPAASDPAVDLSQSAWRRPSDADVSLDRPDPAPAASVDLSQSAWSPRAADVSLDRPAPRDDDADLSQPAAASYAADTNVGVDLSSDNSSADDNS